MQLYYLLLLGYRHVHLRTTNWEPIENATLFVEVTMEDWIGPPSKNKVTLSVSQILL